MKKNIIAEALGTYLLVLFGTGAIIIHHETNAITHLGIALTFGVIVTLLIHLFQKESTHFNPAVTIALWARGDVTLSTAATFISAQVIGALAASLTLRLAFGNVAQLGATLPSTTWQQALFIEIFLTALLMAVILRAPSPERIGAIVFLEALVFGPITGASMNPARSIGPALISGATEHLWVYIAAPIIGALLLVMKKEKTK